MMRSNFLLVLMMSYQNIGSHLNQRSIENHWNQSIENHWNQSIVNHLILSIVIHLNQKNIVIHHHNLSHQMMKKMMTKSFVF